MKPEEIDEVVKAYLRQRGFGRAGRVVQREEQQQHSGGSSSGANYPDIPQQINFRDAYICDDQPEDSPEQPSSVADNGEFGTLFGRVQDTADPVKHKEVLWGLLEDPSEGKFEKSGISRMDTEVADGEVRGEFKENKGTALKKLRKDKVAGATAKASDLESDAVARFKPELALHTMPLEVERSIFQDLRKSVLLSSVVLPSVWFSTFINTHKRLNCASISNDGSLLAGGFSDSSLKMWDMAKCEQQNGNSSLQDENELGSNEHSPSASMGEGLYTLFSGHCGPIHSITFCPFGNFFLSSSSDSTIRLWNTNVNANIVCYKGHNYPVWDVQFSPFGKYFASASHDRTAKIWSVDRLQPLRIMAGHLSDVDCVQWHTNSKYIATGSYDQTVRLWDVQSANCHRSFIGHRSMILCLAMSPDGRHLASGDEDGIIMMWDLATGRSISPLVGHSSCIWSLSFSLDSAVLASGSADCTIKLWDVLTSSKLWDTEENTYGSANILRLLKTSPTKSTPVYALQFSKRNLLFAAGPFSDKA